MYRKAANNSTTGQSNPLPMTAIEENTDISKSTNRFLTGTTYNDAGMVIADNKFRSMNFSYDANGRQVNATNTGTSTTAQTVYDALGNRVATKINDSWQFVIYDAFGKLVAEYGTQGEGNGGVSYVLQDWQGSVRASVNNNGFIQARFDFTAFGEEINLNVGLRSIEQGYSGDATTRQGYGLTEKDSSGLNHTWFRKQEQRAGRWTSPDPYKGSMNLRNPQSFNRYNYVESQPTNFIDPSGLQLERICETWAWYDYIDGEWVYRKGSDFQKNCVWIWVSNGSLGSVTVTGEPDSIVGSDTPLNTTIPQQQLCLPGTVQLGLNGSVVGGVLAGTASAGIAIDGSGNIGLYLEYGGGVGAGLRGGVGGQVTVTNANQIVDLNGQFVNVGAGGGAGGDVNLNLVAGFDRNGTVPVLGAGVAGQLGGGGGVSLTLTNTHVLPLGNPFGGNLNGC